MKSNSTLLYIALAIATIGVGLQLRYRPRIALIDTPKHLIAFTESAKAQKDVQAAEDDWRGKMKLLHIGSIT